MDLGTQACAAGVEPRLLEKALDAAMARGADYADIFVENSRRSSINFLDQRVDKVVDGRDCGAGLRIIQDTHSIYGYTNDLREESLLRLAKLVAAAAEEKGQERPAVRLEAQEVAGAFAVGTLAGIAKRQKLPVLVAIDQACRASGPGIKQVDLTMAEATRAFQLATSEGRLLEHTRQYVRLVCTCTAERDGEKQSISHAPGTQGGFDFFTGLDPQSFVEYAAEVALKMAAAGYPPQGEMPVIIGSGSGGVIFHEACGHPLETTAIQKGASPFVGKLGQQVAAACVTAIDDGTQPGLWGSLPIDDEGEPSQRTVLIDKGVLKSYLVDRLGALKTGYARTGSGRRQSYRFAPASRMRNTYIAAHTTSFAEMLASTERGLFAKSLGGGSVTPGTGDYNFSVREAYLIENGRLTRPVRGATLIGNGPVSLARIESVGDQVEHWTGMCGSVSGSIPVTVGQPAIKVSSILVGGRDQAVGGGQMSL